MVILLNVWLTMKLKEIKNDDDESDDLGKAVQTDLTSTYISKLEENIVLMDN